MTDSSPPPAPLPRTPHGPPPAPAPAAAARPAGSSTLVTATADGIEIRPARIPEDLDLVRQLFRAYAQALGIDLGFQDFEAELVGLPGKYTPPRGCLLLAWRGDEAIGCIALRPIDDARCEMKRLYLRPDIRGGGLGRRLASRLCDEARQAGYRQICLDTLPTMTAARALYADLGFTPTAPYVYNPLPGAIFLALDL